MLHFFNALAFVVRCATRAVPAIHDELVNSVEPLKGIAKAVARDLPHSELLPSLEHFMNVVDTLKLAFPPELTLAFADAGKSLDTIREDAFETCVECGDTSGEKPLRLSMDGANVESFCSMGCLKARLKD